MGDWTTGLNRRWAAESTVLVRDALPAALAVLSASFVLLAGSQFAHLGPGAWGLAVVALVSAAACGAGALAVRRRPVAARWANPAALALVALVGGNLAAYQAASASAAHLYHFVWLLAGGGLIFLSLPWLAAGWAVTLALWYASARAGGVPTVNVSGGFALAGGVAMSCFAYAVRVTTVARLLESRQREAQRLEELRGASAALSERERQYRQMFTQMLNGFAMHEVVFDAAGQAVDYRFLDINAAFERLTGLRREQVLGRRATEVIPGLEAGWVQRYGAVVTSGKPDHFEGHVGAWDRCYEVVAYPLEKPKLAVVFSEVTERVRSQEALRRREAHYRAAAEVNHRVRNNLASLLGLLALMRRRVTGVEQFSTAIEERLRAMAHVHNLLAQAHWSDVELPTLTSQLLSSMQNAAPHRGPTTVEGPPVRLSTRQITPLAMALAELFTNSCKHGAHRLPGGSVAVTWTVDDQDGQRRVALQWREQCAEPVPVSPPRSLGLELIEGFVTFELGGEAHLRFKPDGADHTLIFTAEGAAPQPPTDDAAPLNPAIEI